MIGWFKRIRRRRMLRDVNARTKTLLSEIPALLQDIEFKQILAHTSIDARKELAEDIAVLRGLLNTLELVYPLCHAGTQASVRLLVSRIKARVSTA